MEINEDHELSVYVFIVLDRTVGWEARELAGRAIAAIARSYIWLVSKKSGREFPEGVADHVMEAGEQHERVVEMWREYEETRDRAAMLAEFRDIVNRMESQLPE